MVKLFSRHKIIITVISLILLAVVFGLAYNLTVMSDITYDISKMMSNAESLYNEGDVDQAYYQMLLYTQERPHDKDGWIILGDYATELDDTEKATEHYRMAASCEECSENQLGESDRLKYFDSFSSVESLKIYPSAKRTQGMTITLTSDNLTPQNTLKGRIVTNETELSNDENYLTTDWFPVDESKGYVYITGNINCGEWQFIDDEGSFSKYIDKSSFRNTDFHGFDQKVVSVAQIPKRAVKARVTYYDKNITSTVKADDKIFVGYGKKLIGYTNYTKQTFEIPDLKETQYVEYKNKKWTLVDGDNKQELDLPAISAKSNVTINLDGDICGMVDVNLKSKAEITADKSLKYGIKYSTKSAITTCERIGSAQGMNFDYTVDDEWYYGTGNDFDKAYPWCEMKLCNVKVDEYGEETITYEGEENFTTDGTNGNVMVEIPKFYTKREVKDGYEYIWISGKKHKGYELEPVFIESYGEEADYVYMSAYLGGLKDDKIVSMANTYPVVMIKYGEVLEGAENNGEGFDEMNYLMVSALQKLFTIETGTLDSSEILAGDTYMYYQYDTKDFESSGYACEDGKNTNTIKIYNNFNTIKICEGSSITIFNGWNSYKNNDNTQREVLKLTSTDDYIEITFDGKPMNIKKHKTMVSSIPAKTGKTDKIKYCTGTMGKVLGKNSFKYRHIENLYGSALIMLDDDSYVIDSYFYYETDDGYTNYVDYELAEQPIDLTNYDAVNTTMCIKQMGYDEEHPTIMLPTVVGKGASIYGYYSDIWMYTPTNDYSKRYLTYGGADDIQRSAGVFHLRAVTSSYESYLNCFSARIMYKS